MFPLARITEIPFAKPTMNAAFTILEQPPINTFVVPLIPIPLRRPTTTASVKNVAAI